jgi:RNA polymerase sigma-70 factor, ECF subfamily
MLYSGVMTASDAQYAAETDEELMGRVADGDAGAFAAIYDRHAAAALGVARRMIRQQGAAEDVVQEAFLALWRSGTYHPAKGSVRGFLLRIVHNAAIDHLRRERSRGAGRHVDERFAHPVAADDQPHVEAERADAARCVREALATLPQPQQESLALAYFGGLTHGEIALAIGVPIGTVKSRLRLGLEKLRPQVDMAFCD